VYSNCVALTPLRSVRTAFCEGCYTFPLKTGPIRWTSIGGLYFSSIFPILAL